MAAEPARVAPEDFAILPWSWTPADAAVLEEIRACGFNLAGFVSPDALDMVQAAGLKGVVSHPSIHVGDNVADRDAAAIQKDVAALVEKVGRHPAVFAYSLRDEPKADLFPALARYVEAFRQADPQARCYINLFPNYASMPQLGVATYDEYLEKFVTMVKPPFVSYDHYALMADGSMRPQYFPNLEAARKVALAHNLPFWNIVLSNAHFHYAEPSDTTFRFQAYTTLAYGARGISYFTYFSPSSGNYRLAPVDQFGHKTPTWDMLRHINLQIHALAPTYLKLRSVNVFHTGDIPEGCRDLSTSKYVAELAGGLFVVGEFEGSQGTPFIMLVNKDLTKSARFDVKFKEPGQVMQTNSYSGATHPWAGENNWLAPGQGMLLSLKK